MRLPRYLLVPGTAALMAGTLTLTVTAAAPAGTSHAASQARFVSAARNALARYLRHYRPQLMLAGHPHARANAPLAADSFNWSGYADGSKTTKAGRFTRVSGSWTTPSVKCGAEDQLTSEWVGLDGWISSSLEQLGTLSWCYRGAAVYFTWWEMFPTGKGLIRVGNTLKPGDKITASVTRSGTNYTLKLTDATTPANSFTTMQTCPAATCTDTSAEWIAERPAFGIGIAPLAHYNAFKLTNGRQTSGGKAGTIGSFATVNKVTMIDATQAYNLNDVSSLTSKNSSFSTTWQNSY
jgi:Peptidase A4 family